MTKPTSGMNTMTNLCNHKRKMFNSENRFSKYAFEITENRKKRKLSGVQQHYSFPLYECDKSSKENFSQISNSHIVRYYLYFCINDFIKITEINYFYRYNGQINLLFLIKWDILLKEHLQC